MIFFRNTPFRNTPFRKSNQNNQNREKRINKFLQIKMVNKMNNSYNPNLNNKKILLLFATHTDTLLKKRTSINNLSYFNFECIDIAVSNSKNLPFNPEMQTFYEKNNIKYYEINNDNSFGFNKWNYLLSKIDYKLYDYVIFMNDSFIIQSNINDYINSMIKKDTDLYGYTDSSETRYHYQSYLFSIKSSEVDKLINLINSKKNITRNYQEAVYNYELQLIDNFVKKDCYLKIAYLPINKKKNIFFHNDYLYSKLQKTGILPFTKIKRLTWNPPYKNNFFKIRNNM